MTIVAFIAAKVRMIHFIFFFNCPNRAVPRHLPMVRAIELLSESHNMIHLMLTQTGKDLSLSPNCTITKKLVST